MQTSRTRIWPADPGCVEGSVRMQGFALKCIEESCQLPWPDQAAAFRTGKQATSGLQMYLVCPISI